VALRGHVVGVVGLDAGEAPRREALEVAALDAVDAGVGEGRRPAGAAHEGDRLLGLEAVAADVGGPTLPEVAVEGLLHARDHAPLHHRAGDVRPPERLPAAELLDL